MTIAALDLDWDEIVKMRVGGPQSMEDFEWYGLRCISVDFGLNADGSVFATFHGESDLLWNGARLTAVGFRRVKTVRFGSDVEITALFRWLPHQSAFYPEHWFARGLERCVAMCRILGPNETLWPEMT